MSMQTTTTATTYDGEGQPRDYCPRCGRRHQSWWKVAECRWPGNIWITGNPPPSSDCFAVVSFCRFRAPTVTLHPTRTQAEQSLATVNHTGCGGGCSRAHRLIVMRERV